MDYYGWILIKVYGYIFEVLWYEFTNLCVTNL